MKRRLDSTQGPMLRAIEAASWALLAFGVFAALALPLKSPVQLALFILLPVIAIYLLFFFHWLYPRFRNRPWINSVPAIMNIVMISALDYLIGDVLSVEIIFIVIIVNAAIRVGRRFALVAGALSAVAIVTIDLARPNLSSSSIWLSDGLVIVVYFVAAYLAGSQADVIRRQSQDSDSRNRNLKLLLEASAAASASLELKVTLPLLAEKIAKGLPVTLCRLSLLDRTGQTLVDMGVYPLHAVGKDLQPLGQQWSLKDLPCHRQAIETGKALVLRQSDPSGAMGQAERAALLFDELQSACLVPLVFEGQPLGILSLGEARFSGRESFDEHKLELLNAIAAQTSSLINNAQLHRTVQRNAERAAVLNQVGQAINSTIEMDSLLDLIRQQLSRIIPTDTYYVGLHAPGSEFIDLKMIFDEGQSFPPEKIPYGMGMTGRVIEHREPFLFQRLSSERTQYPGPLVAVGSPRLSESWLGVPLLMSDGFTGLLAIASYMPDMFDEDDKVFLTSVAGQVALALDNARHHAQVEEQARVDSLTGAFNHGYILKRLQEELEIAKAAAKSVSLIMLDIDHFKRYNDTYGHVMGDHVLSLIVESIRVHLKQADAVGRWGGEEFAIVLPNASTEQALVVAARIRESLA
ncbi:MAG TPA: diguanylate cyclase, partial [Anaerolineae bacterium]